MGVPALERCVGDVKRFINEHWARVPLLHAGGGATFDDLASLDDLDRMVSSLGLRASSLRMVKDGSALPAGDYTIAPSSRSRGSEAIVDAAAVYERFLDGATIVVEGLHRYWEPLTDFCRALEVALGHRSQVNAYITPPGAHGFDMHRDEHDVFVLQVSGSKHWVIHGRDERVMIDHVLDRGESLYIPAGFPHAATAGASASAHLTVGILTHSSSDVLNDIVKLASTEPAFQGRLTADETRDLDSLRATVERHVEELRTWLDKADVDALVERVARRVRKSAQPILRGQLRQLALLDAIDADTRLLRRRGATCLVMPRGDVIEVVLVDRELEMPGFVRGAMEIVSDADELLARDLHPHLDPHSALVLVRRLVREGLLEVAVDE
jgi:bifunctional lysine-specific demethylase and histidyl-hydroxylase NO66